MFSMQWGIGTTTRAIRFAHIVRKHNVGYVHIIYIMFDDLRLLRRYGYHHRTVKYDWAFVTGRLKVTIITKNIYIATIEVGRAPLLFQ